MRQGVYYAVSRPADVEHHHSVLVFDTHDRLHLPLTRFAKAALACTAQSTMQAYLSALLPFFTFLEQEEGIHCAWDSVPADVRYAVEMYLVHRLQCKVRPHRLGFQLVATTGATPSYLHLFLSCLKLFYHIMCQEGRYAYPHPLLEKALPHLASTMEEPMDFPPMPAISGVVAPPPKKRLTDSYFNLVGEEWVPQIVDDPALPTRVLEGGRRLSTWGRREECVTRLLFETGARISEIVGLTLGDWASRGCLQEATTFSKGSHGKRVKFLRFTRDTTLLLRAYFDNERCALDPAHCSLDTYLSQGQQRTCDLTSIPLFLSRQPTPYTAKTYREHVWNPACRNAGIEADVHQARHWYVTMAIRTIYEQARTEGEVQRRLKELIEYMKWRSGRETMEAYEHYFDASRHAEIQDAVHGRLAASLQQSLVDQRGGGKSETVEEMRTEREPVGPADDEFAFLLGER